MKSQYLFIAYAFIASILFSSCSRFENISVSKRHYRGGFYVDLGGVKPETVKSIKAENINEAKSITPVAIANNSPVSLSELKELPLAQQAAVSPSTIPKHKHQAAAKLLANASPNAVIGKEEQLNTYIPVIPENAKQKNASDAPDWVIIVFAILIPPLGVGLKFGIVDKFWISLVLTLLFWLPGAIYSVIVVTQK